MRTPSLGDPPTLRLRALEVPLELTLHGFGAADLTAAVEAAWDWCLDDQPSEPVRRLSILLDPEAEALATTAPYDLAGSSLANVMDRLSPLITTMALTERAGSLAMFHACALADPESGATAVLFGPSGAGKTTLACALGLDLAYLTDEAAGLDGLAVVPYPKPLSILARPDSTVKEQVSPTQLGLLRPQGTCELRALVQLRRDPGHTGAPLVDVLDTLDALVEVVTETSFSRSMDRPLHRLAGLMHAVGGVRRVTYSDSRQLLPVIRMLLDGAS